MKASLSSSKRITSKATPEPRPLLKPDPPPRQDLSRSKRHQQNLLKNIPNEAFSEMKTVYENYRDEARVRLENRGQKMHLDSILELESKWWKQASEAQAAQACCHETLVKNGDWLDEKEKEWKLVEALAGKSSHTLSFYTLQRDFPHYTFQIIHGFRDTIAKPELLRQYDHVESKVLVQIEATSEGRIRCLYFTGRAVFEE